MNRRDIVFGSLVVILLGAALVWFLRNKVNIPQISRTPSPQATPLSKLEDTLRQRFNIEIPEDQDKAELKDVSGSNASGVVTRKFENGIYNLVILADLPDPAAGQFYEVWLVRGETQVAVGRLTIEKGGWLLDYQSRVNYTDYNKVIVTLEKVNDGKPETKVLEANF